MVGESEVVLDDKRVLEPRGRAFFPTFAEWAADGNIEQVIVSERFGGTTGPETIYTVPANHTLFITSCWISAAETANLSRHSSASLNISGFDVRMVEVHVDHTAGQHGGNQSLAQSFPMPVRVDSKGVVTIQFRFFNDGVISGGFVGYLLPKKISIR